MPDLFARPLGPDGKPTGPMRRLGIVEKITAEPVRDQWEKLRPIRIDQPYAQTFTIDARATGAFWELVTGRPEWLWTAWLDGRGPAPVSRGTAWQTGAFATFQRQTIPRAARRNGWRSAEEIAALIRAAARPQYYRNRLARDYPPPAEPCPDCVRMADPWQRALRIVAGWKISRDELLTDHYDFMPHYPNGGHR